MEKDKPDGLTKKCENTKKRKFLGPVCNLEDYVNSNWWKGLFNSLYLKTDGDVVEDPKITSLETDYFSSILDLGKNDFVLDICCGQGRHCLELSRRGFKNLFGIDYSHYLIRRAKVNAKKESLNIKFRQGDVRKLPFETDTFDVVMILGNSFGYFENANDDEKVLREIFRVLKPWGKLLIDITDGEYIKHNYSSRSWEWLDKTCFVCRERSISSDAKRLISREVVMHLEKGLIADQFYAERLYSKSELKEILEKSDFSNINFHGFIETKSQRNQDLGMMEKRRICTSIVKKDWAPEKKKSKSKKNEIIVLLGDPSKPDPLKPLYIFDDDDFYTIDKLKGALKKIKRYSFNYLTDHDKMIDELMKKRDKISFVLNLCDEGYYNDPTKELHITALLEMLQINYSGANPQCLAYCYDKSLVRGIAKEIGIPVPNAVFINPEELSFELPFSYPVIVKPNFGDSSFGITQNSVVYSNEQLLKAVSEIKEGIGYGKPILVEEYLTSNDISVGIIGNPHISNYTILPIVEEDYSDLPEDLPRICGYEAKWDPESPYSRVKSKVADIPEETKRAVEEWCLMLFIRLECRDYARFDWRLDEEGIPKLLEVNPNPGWCWDGHLAKMSDFYGWTYSEMLNGIINAVEERLELKVKK